jgi:hypothetical protein
MVTTNIGMMTPFRTRRGSGEKPPCRSRAPRSVDSPSDNRYLLDNRYTGGQPVGRALLVRRLAGRDLRRRPAQALLLLLVITSARGITADAMAEGRAAAPARVDRPEVTAGTWVRAGGVVVVVERAFAAALGVRVGDHVTLGGRRFKVTGIAVTAAVPVHSQVCFYGGCSGPRGRPRSFDTGLVWVTPAAARSLAAPGGPLSYDLSLRLRHPAAPPRRSRAPTSRRPDPGRRR